MISLRPDDHTDPQLMTVVAHGTWHLKVCAVFLTLISISEFLAGQPSLLPYPQEIKWNADRFYPEGNGPETDPRVVMVKVESIRGVELNLDEAYRLLISKDSIVVLATGEEGFFRARSTISQLIETEDNRQYLRGCTITDWPAFRIRGFMHDSGRSFIPVSELKREVEILSQLKINTFHWHLTEDIAWRLESELLGQMTGGNTALRDSGNFYTREQVKDFLNFCKERYVTVIPEIDMPGHSDSFTRATGYKMQSDKGKEMLKVLLGEACRLFDGPFFHIGTDEVQITDTLFVREMTEVVRSCGKEVIGWFPGGKMDEKAVHQLWADVVLPENRVVIDSRYRYLNHTDPYSDLFGIYNSGICDSGLGSPLLAGGICCLWNDRKPRSSDDIIISNAFYPMMFAFAERSWLGGGDNIKQRGVRMGLPGDFVYERFREFEGRMLNIRNRMFPEIPFPYLAQSDIIWMVSDQLPNHGNLTATFSGEEQFVKEPEISATLSSFTPAAGAAVYLRHTWGPKVPSFYNDPLPDHTAFAFTWIYSPEDQPAGLIFATHNYGRSERDASPPHGKWDYKESRVWINGNIIEAPAWENPGLTPGNLETPYSDENFWARSPIPISLKKGWNSLVLKLPAGQFSTPETRLVKWMFTALVVDSDGKRRPEGLFHSPYKVLPAGTSGGLQLPDAWGDNMVLQRDRPIRLSGLSHRNEQVEVTLAGRKYFADVSASGQWETELEPLKAGGPYELKVNDSYDTLIIRNMLAGEVWLCSGQSNMEWQVSNSDGWDSIRDSPEDDNLRIINFRRRSLPWNEPWDSATLESINNLDFFERGEWSAASPGTVKDFSAVAFYFGRRLRAELNVPVGLIEMAVGGSPAEAWIERKTLEKHPQLAELLKDYRQGEFQEEWVREVTGATLKATDDPGQRHPFEPAYLFESGISHIAGFPVKGFLWYQGESNANLPDLYEVMLPEMVKSWREAWNEPSLPFYFAQLSSLDRPSWPEFRNSQRKLVSRIPRSGMIVTTDIGHPTDVHPRNKAAVGERFASLALSDTYGRKEFQRSPEPVKAVRKGDKIIVTFRYVRNLRTSDDLPVKEIEISETGDYFQSAPAHIRGNRLIIKSSNAVAVRYGWKPFSEGNLTGDAGLPVPTFKLNLN